MTPNCHTIAPPPLITRIAPLSNRYWQMVRAWHATRAFRASSARAARIAGAIVFVVLPLVLKNPVKLVLRGVLHVARLIDRLADAILTFLHDTLITVIKALAKPMLALGALFGIVLILNPDNWRSLKEAAPSIAALTPEAGAKPLAPSIAKTPPPGSRTGPAKLALFHEPAQRFKTERAAIQGLADALNIPSEVVEKDVSRALALADANARAMRGFVGRFPLPATTSNRLLAALTPSDVRQLALLLEYATTIGKREFTLNANLASGDLSLDTRVTALSSRASAGTCFRYAMTFMRRTFRHALTISACRKGQAWTFPTQPNERTPQ